MTTNQLKNGSRRSTTPFLTTKNGIDRINRETIEALNGQFRKSLEPGHYKKVLKEKPKIRISIKPRL